MDIRASQQKKRQEIINQIIQNEKKSGKDIIDPFKHLSGKLGISRDYLMAVENGRKHLSPDTIKKLQKLGGETLAKLEYGFFLKETNPDSPLFSAKAVSSPKQAPKNKKITKTQKRLRANSPILHTAKTSTLTLGHKIQALINERIKALEAVLPEGAIVTVKLETV